MGTGTDREPAGSVEAQSGSPLEDGVDVKLTPADVWVLGQLVEEGAVRLPSRLGDEIRDGYRILRTAGYEPPPNVSAPETGELEGSGPLREVRLAEITSTEAGAEPAGEGVDREELTRVAAATPGVDVDLDSVASAHGRLADAVERLADEAGGSIDLSIEGIEGVGGSRDSGLARLALDWAVVGIGAVLATLFVVASALVGDPVFAFLGVGVLGVAGALAYPYLVDAGGSG